MFDRAAIALLSPLDAMRAVLLRLFARPGRAFFADRQARVVLIACVSITLTFALCTVVPMWMLTLGPLVLGVPHLLADVRYLIARPGLHRRGWPMALVLVPLAITWVWPRMWIGALATVLMMCVAPGRAIRKLIVLIIAANAIMLSWRFGYSADVVNAQLHNFVTLALWWMWTARGKVHVLPLAFTILGCALILSGAMDAVAMRFGGLSDIGQIRFDSFARVLSFSDDPNIMMRWALLFAFMQSVHYVTWLRLIPEDDRERVGVRSFVSSYHALVQDLGRPVIAFFAFSFVAVLLWGFFDLDGARIGYLRSVFFHGYLEYAVIALAFLQGRRFFGAHA